VAPDKVRFRVMLEGQDRVWRELANQRHVQYTNLPPRKYRFRVTASNRSGVWNEQGDTLEFSIAPAYYQTNWFRALCAVLFLTLLWAAYQLRVRRLRYEFEMTLDARVGERTRIARDLHDTLLQSFHGLLLRFQTVSQLLPEHSDAKEKLDSAIEQAAAAITEGRDAVQGLRDSTVEGSDLALAISTLGEEIETGPTGHRPAFHVAVGGESRELRPIVRDEIYKLTAEALRNAFRHAQAQRVEVEIRYDNEQFRLRVRDDGKGIDAAVLARQGSEGHFGLDGMRERATVIGGEVTVWSEVDAGTEVELCVPASKAYAAARRRSWFSRRFSAKV
jgi:signal transduction histidine kinase